MTADDRELLRHATLECLAATHPVPVTPAGVLRRVQVSMPCTVSPDDQRAALLFLRDLGHADFLHDPAGATQWWRITAAGTLALERRP